MTQTNTLRDSINTFMKGDRISLVLAHQSPALYKLLRENTDKPCNFFYLDWSKRDNPSDEQYWLNWNPLSPKCMPADKIKRQLYIDQLIRTILPEPVGSADPYWVIKARDALTGFIQFIINKCEAGNYENIPQQYFGQEPSLPMLVDWYVEMQLKSHDEIEAVRESDPNLALFADPVKNFLMAAIAEARNSNYESRAIIELTQLANTPDKERGSILSSMDSALSVFKNAAVKERTNSCDISLSNLLGFVDESDDKRPSLLFILDEEYKYKVLTNLLFDAINFYTTSSEYQEELKNKESCAILSMNTNNIDNAANEILSLYENFTYNAADDANYHAPEAAIQKRINYKKVLEEIFEDAS